MHNLSANPIKINLSSSLWLAGYLLLTHLSALVLIVFIELEVYQFVCLTALIVFSLIYHWRRYFLHLAPNSVIELDWSNHRGWLIRMKDGSKLKVELSPSSFISRYVVILHFKMKDRGKRNAVIPGDAIDSDQLRRLRVLLRMGNHFGV